MNRFNFPSPEQARAAIYDAAMLILAADGQVALPVDAQTIRDLSEICRRIELGQRLSKSPLLEF